MNYSIHRHHVCFFRSQALPLIVAMLVLCWSAAPSWAIVSVTSPAYRSDVSGNTTISISAPGQSTAVAKCWQSGPGLGVDSTVATISLDGSGNGSFVFPANSYPRGPITIRITAGSDTCYLQLYNTGGTSWKEGLAAAPQPAQAAGMALAFADDFDGPLSISSDGVGTTYRSHTIDRNDPDGNRDFSRPKFRDFGDSNDPFYQRDTYLRIRGTTIGDETGPNADPNARSQNWNSDNAGTGLINSYDSFRMQVPFYMECRFIAQRVTGSWPAFWALSIPNGSEEWGELDVIEAYGSSSEPYQYIASFHNWPSDSNYSYHYVKMDGRIGGTSSASWSEAMHTYGCLVTETTTTYYLDDVAVWSHPTRSEWLQQDFYFLINYAFAGRSNWLSALGRYGFQSDMYVDWVRVYQGSAVTATDVRDAEADAFVRSGSHGNTNYGTSADMMVKLDGGSYARESYLRFDVSGLENAISSTVALSQVSEGPDAAATTLSFELVNDDGWTESGLTWNNRPTNTTVISTATDFASASMIELDVSDAVRTEAAGDGTLTLRIRSTTAGSSRWVKYATREAMLATERPALLSEVPADGSRVAGADSFVRSGSHANTNYGTDPDIMVKKEGGSYDREGYLRFDVSGLASVTSASIVLTPVSEGPDAAATTLSFELVGDDSWSETGLTWNNRPTASTVLASVSDFSSGLPIVLDITSTVQAEAAGDGTLTLRIRSTSHGSARWVKFGTREATSPSAQPALTFTGGLP
ncbi:MAG: DNRLRE domain-containing protein [Verrucomicrobiota bacterium]